MLLSSKGRLFFPKRGRCRLHTVHIEFSVMFNRLEQTAHERGAMRSSRRVQMLIFIVAIVVIVVVETLSNDIHGETPAHGEAYEFHVFLITACRFYGFPLAFQ